MNRVKNFERKIISKILNIEVKHANQQIAIVENNSRDVMKNLENVIPRVTLCEFKRR